MNARRFYVDISRGKDRNWEAWGAQPLLDAIQYNNVPIDDRDFIVFLHSTDILEGRVSPVDRAILATFFAGRHPPVIVVSGGRIHDADRDAIAAVCPGERVHFYSMALETSLDKRGLHSHFGTFAAQDRDHRYNWEALYFHPELLAAFRMLLQAFILAVTPADNWPDAIRMSARNMLDGWIAARPDRFDETYWSPILANGRVNPLLLCEQHRLRESDLYSAATALRGQTDWRSIPREIVESYRTVWFREVEALSIGKLHRGAP